jgi:hypothetical protein
MRYNLLGAGVKHSILFEQYLIEKMGLNTLLEAI